MAWYSTDVVSERGLAWMKPSSSGVLLAIHEVATTARRARPVGRCRFPGLPEGTGSDHRAGSDPGAGSGDERASGRPRRVDRRERRARRRTRSEERRVGKEWRY